ncbi:MAG: recombinase [Clostridiaceae bacterium]|jgi:hypothetical protein|nr:recombinase [Clostridiaceae bacterium]
MNYKEYEQKCMEIRTRNDVYLTEFREDLLHAGLKDKTIDRHCKNVGFYINTYLMREEPLEMVCGTYSDKITDFLGYFFIRKCMWSTPDTIKSTAASIKKFYHSMLQRGHIVESNYSELTSTIDDNIIEWLNDCEAYNDPDTPNPFDFF